MIPTLSIIEHLSSSNGIDVLETLEQTKVFHLIKEDNSYKEITTIQISPKTLQILPSIRKIWNRAVLEYHIEQDSGSMLSKRDAIIEIKSQYKHKK